MLQAESTGQDNYVKMDDVNAVGIANPLNQSFVGKNDSDTSDAKLSSRYEHFSDEDWEKLLLLNDYIPNCNGTLQEDYVKLKAKVSSFIFASVSAFWSQLKVAVESLDANREVFVFRNR